MARCCIGDAVEAVNSGGGEIKPRAGHDDQRGNVARAQGPTPTLRNVEAGGLLRAVRLPCKPGELPLASCARRR